MVMANVATIWRYNTMLAHRWRVTFQTLDTQNGEQHTHMTPLMESTFRGNVRCDAHATSSG